MTGLMGPSVGTKANWGSFGFILGISSFISSKYRLQYIDSVSSNIRYSNALSSFFRNETMQGGSALWSPRGGALDRANN